MFESSLRELYRLALGLLAEGMAEFTPQPQLI